MKRLLVLLVATSAVCLEQYPTLDSHDIHRIFELFPENSAIRKQCIGDIEKNAPVFRRNISTCVQLATILDLRRIASPDIANDFPWIKGLHVTVAQLLRNVPSADKDIEHNYTEAIARMLFANKWNKSQLHENASKAHKAAQEFTPTQLPQGLSIGKHFESMLEPEHNDMPGRR